MANCMKGVSDLRGRDIMFVFLILSFPCSCTTTTRRNEIFDENSNSCLRITLHSRVFYEYDGLDMLERSVGFQRFMKGLSREAYYLNTRTTTLSNRITKRGVSVFLKSHPASRQITKS